MKSTRKKVLSTQKKQSGMALKLIKSSLFGCVATIALILLYALILKWEILSDGSIPLITSIIKALCAGFVGLLCANRCTHRVWLWAGSGGALYMLIAFLAFTLVEKSFSINFGLLADVAMGFIAGVAGGFVLQLKNHKT